MLPRAGGTVHHIDENILKPQCQYTVQITGIKGSSYPTSEGTAAAPNLVYPISKFIILELFIRCSHILSSKKPDERCVQTKRYITFLKVMQTTNDSER